MWYLVKAEIVSVWLISKTSFCTLGVRECSLLKHCKCIEGCIFIYSLQIGNDETITSRFILQLLLQCVVCKIPLIGYQYAITFTKKNN